MKIILSLALAFFFAYPVSAQQYWDAPGTEKFAGTWRYTTRRDTIQLFCKVDYYGGGDIKVKGAKFYYKYVTGTSIVRDNFSNYHYDNKTDFGGSKPYGSNLDTLEFMGKDILKRKIDEGYIIFNTAGNQLKFVRKIGLSGGGLNYYREGEGPLPDFTLPDTITFTKWVLMEEKTGN